MKVKDRRAYDKRKKKLKARLRRDSRDRRSKKGPVLGVRTPTYEVSGRIHATVNGGLSAFLTMAHAIGLIDAINTSVPVLKRQLPYTEADHVMTLALSTLANGTCLDDVRLLRNDDTLLDMLDAKRLPDATTVGDFTRRFTTTEDVTNLMDAINSVRPAIWKRRLTAQQRTVAYLDVDGTIAETCGRCREGMDIAFNGVWGYHPLITSLANTMEPLYLVNRPGNRPSDDGAVAWVNRSIDLVEQAFDAVCIRGDTAFYRMSSEFDSWDDRGVGFIIGVRIQAPLEARFDALDAGAWQRFERVSDAVDPALKQRTRPRNVKEQIVREREYKNFRLQAEHIAEMTHQPAKCKKSYRLIVLRKNISVAKGENRLFDEIRYFAYITNDPDLSPEEVVRHNNARCNQENLIEQLKNSLNALRMPVGDLHSNWAHMVMVALAWSLKAWFALLAPCAQRWHLLRMEFRGFINRFVKFPCQVVTSGRRLILRILSVGESLPTFFSTFEHIRRLRLG